MFRPWLTASGPSGTATVTAFGRIKAIDSPFQSTGLVDFLRSHPQPDVDIRGMWALLASVAAIVTILTTAIYLRKEARFVSYLVRGSNMALAVFVVATLLYLDGKASDLRSLTDADDLGTGPGGVLVRIFQTPANNLDQISVTNIDMGAIVGCATAIAATVIAITAGLRDQPPDPTARGRHDANDPVESAPPFPST